MKTAAQNKIKSFFIAAFLILGASSVNAQNDAKLEKKIIKETHELLREAEDDLGENDFASAEASYRKAVSKHPDSEVAKYNMANMYYGKEKALDATERYKEAAEVSETKEAKHKIFHNLGNSFMDQKKYSEAVEAYKNALRNNPKDEETRYNLALAKKMLEEEKKNGGGGEDNKEDKKDQGDQNKDQKGGEGDQEQDKKEGEDKEDKGGDKKEDPKKEPEKPGEDGKPKDPKEEKGDGKPQQPQQAQPQPGQLSPQQVKSLLEAMNNEEKKVLDKVNAEKAKGVKTRPEKDW